MQERLREHGQSLCPARGRRTRRGASSVAALTHRHDGGVPGVAVAVAAAAAAAASSALARSFSSVRISSTASKSPSVSCFALRFKRERLFSAFFNSFATCAEACLFLL